MREIKFRIWDKWDERMICPNGGDLIGWHGPTNWKDCYELMQFTGLTDENGREIYEGDIVNLYDPDGGSSPIGKIEKVEWGSYSDGEYINNLECWMAGEYLPLSEAGTRGTWGHDAFVVEVIGNIYENPELLKKEGS